jgi:hypothetical protein
MLIVFTYHVQISYNSIFMSFPNYNIGALTTATFLFVKSANRQHILTFCILLYCGVAALKVWDGINLFNARVV